MTGNRSGDGSIERTMKSCLIEVREVKIAVKMGDDLSTAS